MNSPPFFELQNVSKYFSKVIANHDVSFTIEQGQVLALLGENGAGKSTIMKILYGLYQADEGRILMNGAPCRITSPKEAIALGISMIQQHFSLVMTHTVTENIILGHEHGIIDRRACETKIREMSEKYAFNIDPGSLVGDLTVGERQKVEILKALYLNAKLLIMDEPTAVLTPKEAETLMDFVRGFIAAGNSVVFITHKLKEVMEVADRIVVMRAGEIGGILNKSETDEKELARLMIGKDIIAAQASGEPDASQEICLDIQNLTVKGEGAVPALDNLTIQIKKGEILGIAGVSGNGQQELCEAVCGARRADAGKIYLDGEDLTNVSISGRIERGLGYVPSDRHRDGMVMDMSLAENMLLKNHSDKRWLKNGFIIDEKTLAEHTAQAIADFNIKAPGPQVPARSLSGGNQQKVILAREVDCGQKLIVFDQPTRGLDLGAIDHIHKTILKEKEEGKAVLLVSTELSEIFALSDRIAVLYKGRLMGVAPREEMTVENIALMMAGYSQDQGAAQ